MEKDEFVTRKQALALKELGFDEHCLATWEKDIKYPQRWDWDFELRNSTNQEDEVECTAPLKQQVFKWFREKYDLHHVIIWDSETNNFDAGLFGELVIPFLEEDTIFTTYEEAENACIDKLIELAKQH